MLEGGMMKKRKTKKVKEEGRRVVKCRGGKGENKRVDD